MTRTFKELLEIDTIVGSVYQKSPTLKETKFGYSYKRFYEKNTAPVTKEYQEKLVEIRINNASEDKNTKVILVDNNNPRGFQYTKDALIKCMREENELWKETSEKEIEVTPFISSFVPIELNEEDAQTLKGLII